MTPWRLIWRGWRFYARVHVAVALCVLLATAVLAGALILGDSADHTLRTRALERLGRIEFAMDTGPRQVRAELADDLTSALTTSDRLYGSTRVAPVLWAEGVAKTPDGRALANEVRVLGVRPGFFEALDSFGPGKVKAGPPLADDEVILGQPLADQLGAKDGDRIVFVFTKPSPLPVESPLSDPRDNQASMLLTVRIIHGPESLGHFALRPSATPPLNAFVTLNAMQRALGLPGRANLLLFSDGDNSPSPRALSASALRSALTLDDAQLELRTLDDGQLELRSPRVLLEEPVVRAAKAASPEWAYAVTTWFVNELRVGGRTCPYSTVAAVERPAVLSTFAEQPDHPLVAAYNASFGPPPGGVAFFTPLAGASGCLADDEIVINEWLAEDLEAAVGDALTLTYYKADPGRRLVEVSRTFRIVGVTEMAGAAADRELMPEFPGLARAESCRGWQSDWVDMNRVRPKDEAYWTDHRGTPKAFVSPTAARDMWGSSRGSVTAVRFGGGVGEAASVETIERALLTTLDPADLGMTIQPVREQMLASARQSTDLGQLFLALGGGVIVAALLMLWLVLSLAATARSSQAGLLRAVGFTPARVRGLLLAEFSLPVAMGVGVGVAAGVLFARGLLAVLGSTWSGAVGGASLELHVTPLSLAVAGIVSFALSAVAVWMAIRPRQTLRDGLACLRCRTSWTAKRLAVHNTLQRKQAQPSRSVWRIVRTPLRVVVSVVLVIAAAVVAIIHSSPVAWFLAGSAVLVAGLTIVRGLLRSGPTTRGDLRTLRQLAWRNASRRAGPSFALVALLACAAFLILAVGAYRQQPPDDPTRRDSGTGGFALIGQSSTSILGPLVPPNALVSSNSSDLPFAGVAVVPIRVRDGEDASCLNLNRPSQPRLLGVEPGDLAWRGAFVFTKTQGTNRAGWDVLDAPLGDVVPGVADESTIRWSLHKRLGDVIDYTDEQGQPLRVQLVGQLAGSVLQGNVLISRRAFDERFPSAGGFRFFLLDAPPGRETDVAAAITARHSERGLSLVPAAARLAQLQAVENSYISIFQILSALGLVLGTAGLGLVVTRNIQDRRGELATFAAVGFSRARLMSLVLLEHTLLLSLGLVVGVTAAVTALVPRFAAHQDWASGHVIMLLSGVVVVGFASAAVAVWTGFRRTLVRDLRSE